MARGGQDNLIVAGGDGRKTPVPRKCLRDSFWTEITDKDLREHPGWYVKTGTLRVNDELITFYDLNF